MKIYLNYVSYIIFSLVQKNSLAVKIVVMSSNVRGYLSNNDYYYL